jgi:hypothetical protein
MTDFVKVCASQFHGILEDEGYNVLEIAHIKKLTFNVLTVALIATVALGVLGVLSLKAVVILGAISLFGRVVVGQSLNQTPLAVGAHSFFSQRDNISFNGHVILYSIS